MATQADVLTRPPSSFLSLTNSSDSLTPCPFSIFLLVNFHLAYSCYKVESCAVKFYGIKIFSF